MRSILELHRLGDDPSAPFPPTRQALTSPNGLLAWGGDLHPDRLLAAYRRGIFPWYQEGQPVLWWTPVPRCVIVPGDVHLSRRTRRRFNTGVFRLTVDTAFADVVAACAEPRGRDDGTWITRDMHTAYVRLHQRGHAHSLEVWQDDDLVGGVYGLAIGAMFFGESMFSRRSDASKIALVALCRCLQSRGYGLLDCQVGNPHLFSMGAIELQRNVFEDLLHDLVAEHLEPGLWTGEFIPPERW